ncbi:PD40 domain-containing protein [Allokutzneria multivorans]|uniref:PD40 domain-containing protein n=1 Tax=Allokutzneria multivorans TaxID=1142134 RepID=A0ABP7SNQ6_9PSEU
MTKRILLALLTTLLLAGAAITYTVHAMGERPDRQQADASVLVDRSGAVRLDEPGRLVFRNTAPGPDHGKVASVSLADPTGPRRISGLSCDRFYVSAGAGLCLASAPGPLPSAVAVFVDKDLREVRRVELAGVPNRAKLSPDGTMASWTTFVTGDTYTQPGTFSTRTGIMDRAQDQLYSNIEGIPLFLGSERHHAEDINYWGVTFAQDNKHFYATVATGGRTHLVSGDYDTWDARALRENAECPSLSPDGKRLAFKKRVSTDGARPWREHVLDLATMTETPLAETRSVDDQAVWLDARTVAYSLPNERGGSDVWGAPADGSGAPRLLVPWGASPAST